MSLNFNLETHADLGQTNLEHINIRLIREDINENLMFISSKKDPASLNILLIMSNYANVWLQSIMLFETLEWRRRMNGDAVTAKTSKPIDHRKQQYVVWTLRGWPCTLFHIQRWNGQKRHGPKLVPYGEHPHVEWPPHVHPHFNPISLM